MYTKIIKPLLFLLSPEKAHHVTILIFRILLALPFAKSFINKMFLVQHDSLSTEVFGLRFKNPVGLAAGFDKDGKYFDLMRHLGFGFIEIGTVTPRPQSGNPRPRLFRLPKDKAIINRMGFNNDGVDALVMRLKDYKKGDIIIGGNIGKNKDTPNEQANEDFLYCFKALHPYVDYFAINVSSPNTPGLRALQEKEPLSQLLSELSQANQSFPNQKPILLKIAPDLTYEQLDDIIDIVKVLGLPGIIASNTTLDRSKLISDISDIGQGGLSGQPLTSKSSEIVKYLIENSQGKYDVVGVGGIMNEDDANDKFDLGVKLIQVYTGLVYEGPSLVKKILNKLSQAT